MNLKSPVIRRNGLPQGHFLRRAKDARFRQGGQKLPFRDVIDAVCRRKAQYKLFFYWRIFRICAFSVRFSG